jgi:uncharacterized protein HemY
MRFLARTHLQGDELISAAKKLENISFLSAQQPRNVRLAAEFLLQYNAARKLFARCGGGRYDS